jgi:hypothetical protein
VDQYVSVEPMQAVGWREVRPDVRVPDRWEATHVRWVLADLDEFTAGPTSDSGLAQSGEALGRWAQRQPGLSGVVAVVRTSHLGVQVVFELDGPRSTQWHRTEEGVVLGAAVDAAALAAARAAGFEGGHADQAVHAAGRMMRRPGWRTDKRGELCRARLVHVTKTPTSTGTSD